MKRSVVIVFALLTVFVLCMSGCSDFRFNPIGTWTFTEFRSYLGEELIKSETEKDNPYMKNSTLTFKKSGTGYIGSVSDSQKFTYEYTDDTVTISGTNKKGDDFDVKYEVRDDGNTLVRIDEGEVDDDEPGKKIKYRMEYIFKR